LQKNWDSLIKPEKLGVEHGSDPSRTATVVAEPLERGFGMTLGNALRRVLLSSLQGAAVTAVQIDGVLHEFSSIAGVREDVTDIVLNIKQLALRMHGEGPKRMVLQATGPGEVKAGQIQTGHVYLGHVESHGSVHATQGAGSDQGPLIRIKRGTGHTRRIIAVGRPDPVKISYLGAIVVVYIGLTIHDRGLILVTIILDSGNNVSDQSISHHSHCTST
jgi:DNA-directed RNA polymerase alpha subunit